jgi:hypothetical protein
MIHLLLYAWLGAFFAWCAQGRLREGGVWAQPAIAIVVVYIGVVVAPATMYLNLAYPDWSWLYLVDSSRVPALAIVPVLAASGGALLGSYYLAARLVRGDKAKGLLFGLLGSALALAIVVSLSAGRLTHYGSAADFRATPPRTIPLSADKFVLIALVTVTIGVLASAAYVGWELRKDGRRATTR